MDRIVRLEIGEKTHTHTQNRSGYVGQTKTTSCLHSKQPGTPLEELEVIGDARAELAEFGHLALVPQVELLAAASDDAVPPS
jgi:hypothetical protein